MRKFHAVPYNDQTDINLSPMLDVVFIMLIFFIVVAAFIHETGLPVELPNRVNEGPQVEAISVLVQADASYVVNGRALSAASVSSYVRALHAENPEAGFSVLLGPGSTVGAAVVAIEAGRMIGYDVVPIVPAD